MQKINWASHQYDLGHTDIDQQHQQLVEIINELVDQLDQPGDILTKQPPTKVGGFARVAVD